MSRNQVQLNPGFDLPVHTRWYLGVVLFQPPSPELDVRLSPHPALQFPVRHGAFRVVSWLGYCLTCSPSPCIGHYPDHLSTTGTPSPWVSQPLGDPEFSPVRRIVRLGARSSVSPFVTGHSPQRVFHSKQRIRVIAVSPVPGKLRWMECCIVSDLGSANSASPCVQDWRVRLHYFPSCFPASAMLLSPDGFPLQGKALCPRALSLSTFCLYEAILRVIRRRTCFHSLSPAREPRGRSTRLTGQRTRTWRTSAFQSNLLVFPFGATLSHGPRPAPDASSCLDGREKAPLFHGVELLYQRNTSMSTVLAWEAEFPAQAPKKERLFI